MEHSFFAHGHRRVLCFCYPRYSHRRHYCTSIGDRTAATLVFLSVFELSLWFDRTILSMQCGNGEHGQAYVA